MKEIVIKLSDVMYERLIESKGLSTYAFMSFAEAVKNGTELPKGHGRLIDLDKLEAHFYENCYEECGVCPHNYEGCDIFNNAEVLIEADKETETWNGIHAQITAPKGTFDKIWNDTDAKDDI